MSAYRYLCEITLLNERLQTAKAHIHTLKAHIRLLEEKKGMETAEPLSSSNGCPKCGGWWEVDTSTPVGQPVCSKCGYRPQGKGTANVK